MKRRIIKLGKATFVTSLPSKWIRQFGLQKGDYIEMQEQGNSLLVSTGAIQVGKSITVQLPDKKYFLKRLVHVPYRFGYDEIKFTFNDPKTLEVIQDVLYQLLGFEIVEHGSTYCIIKNMAGNNEQEYENIFKRVFMIIGNLLRELHDIVAKKEFERAKVMKKTKDTIFRLVAFCERVLNKQGVHNFAKNSFEYVTVWTVDKIAREIRSISLILQNVETVSKGVVNAFENTKNFYDGFYAVYFKPDLKKIWGYKHENRKIRDLNYELMLKSKGKETLLLHHLQSINSMFNDIAISISEFGEDH